MKLDTHVPFLEGTIFLGEMLAVVAYDPRTHTSSFHILDKSRKLVKTVSYAGEVRSFGTINKLEIFFLLPEEGSWVILNSCTFADEKGKFPFLDQEPANSKVLFFPESKMLGIWEIGPHKKKEGSITFIPYPKIGSEKKPYTVKNIGFYNTEVQQLNNRNLVAYFDPKSEGKIKWNTINIETEKETEFEVNKPDNGEYNLKQVIEISPNVFLLEIDCSKAQSRYMVYNHNEQGKPLRPIKLTLSESVNCVHSIGSWLYFIESNVTAEGVREPNNIAVVSKNSEELIFSEKVSEGLDYESNLIDFSIVRNDSGYHNVQTLKLMTLRATSQKELYVHLLKEISAGKMDNDMIHHILQAFVDE